MSTAGNWSFTRPRLNEALADWIASGPDAMMRAGVEEALMDLILDPLGWGTEDPDQPGVFQRTITTQTGVRIGILYVIPDLAARKVGVADIRTET